MWLIVPWALLVRPGHVSLKFRQVLLTSDSCLPLSKSLNLLSLSFFICRRGRIAAPLGWREEGEDGLKDGDGDCGVAADLKTGDTEKRHFCSPRHR